MIEKGLIGVGDGEGLGAKALSRHPDRFIPSSSIDPNDGMEGIRRLVAEYETYRGACGRVLPRRAPSRRYRSTTRRCTRSTPSALSWASRSSAAPGSRGRALKAACQHVELIDEVMYDFPDLVFVTRHGCEPWTALAVKLMLKWPGLHYSTSAFAPKYYPQDIVNYANTRGADKIIYAGYFPMGLSLERIMTRAAERRVQGRGVAEVPSHQRTAHFGRAGMTDDDPVPRASTRTTTTTRPRTPTRGTSTPSWPSGPCSGPTSTASAGSWWAAG